MLSVSFHFFAVMAPAKWANKVTLAKEVGLSMLLKIILFMKERRNHVSQKEVADIFACRHNVTCEMVEEQLKELHTRKMISTEYQFLSVDAQLFNRVFN